MTRHPNLRTLAAIVAGLVLAPSVAAAGSAEKGKAAYVRHGCWQCHGFEGHGSVAGSKIAPDPMPFAQFSEFVRTTSGAMPPYQMAILSDEDLGDIYAYLQSVPKGPDPKTIPLRPAGRARAR